MYDAPFPAARPAHLRRRSLPAATELWRIDATAPGEWSWDGFPEPRFRFDPASGRFRTRYAGTTFDGAAREKYADSGRFIPFDHGNRHVVHLVADRPLSVLDLRTERNLDALRLDDRISTGHEAAVWDAGHRLVDAALGWWEGLDGFVYRCRTTPETSINVAFFSSEGFAIEHRRLEDCGAALDRLILDHQFTVGFPY